jgi:ubiquinone biosynthesis UbiH/UbiF/VisC/COQ6 family hydroxylase
MTQTASSFDICIHGAGFVGRTLALLLARAGFKVALIDSHVPSGAVDIRAFSLNQTSKVLLEGIGAWPAGAHVTPVMSMAVFGDSGGAARFAQSEEVDVQGASSEPLNWIVDVPALSEKLQVATSGELRITCRAKDDALQAKLHVLCEGNNPQRLAQLGIQSHAVRYPQHAVAARLTCELPHSSTAHQWFNERGEVLALLPMHGNEVALVWSLASEHAKAVHALPDGEFVAALMTSAGHILGQMTLCSHRALWPLQMTRTLNWTGEEKYGDGLSSNRLWVLAGDAAHTIHPLAGQGLNLGLGDAALLAETLQQFLLQSPIFNPNNTALVRKLEGYARARQAAATHMTNVTDGLHLLFAHQNPLVKNMRNLGMKLFDRATSIKRFAMKQAQ